MNENLELTNKQEIERLRKVIDEKNKTISGFKKYDADRKAYYERFEQNYKMMEERFNEFNAAMEACEDLDRSTKQFFERIVNRLYHKRVNDDIEGGALRGVLTRLAKLEQHLSAVALSLVMIKDDELRKAISDEVHIAQAVRANIVAYTKRKLGKIE